MPREVPAGHGRVRVLPDRKKRDEDEDSLEETTLEEFLDKHATLQEEMEPVKKELDEILDEIDKVLEENAEEFVNDYVQKGGE